jgi:hypothetical protein
MRFQPHAVYSLAVRLSFEEAYARICAPAGAATQLPPPESGRAASAAEDAPAAHAAAPAWASQALLEPQAEPAGCAGGGMEAPECDPQPERGEAPQEAPGGAARAPAFLPPPGNSAPSGRRAPSSRRAPAPRAPPAAPAAPAAPRRTRKRAAEEAAACAAIAPAVDSAPRRFADACAGPASPPPTVGFKPLATGAQVGPDPSSPSSCATAADAELAEAYVPLPVSPPPAKLPRRALLAPESPAPPAPAPAPAPLAGGGEASLLGACSVCWEGISVAAPPGSGAELCELRPCEHAYHAGCIAPWLATQNTCPQCRVRVSARWGAAQGLETVPEADTFVQQLHQWVGRMPYDDTICQARFSHSALQRCEI